MAAAASEVFNHMIKMMRKLAPLVLSSSMDMGSRRGLLGKL